MMRIVFFVIILASHLVAWGQNNRDDLNLGKSIQSIGDDNFFHSKEYYNWGASIIKGYKGMYHLFYSRWARKYTFYGWLTHSEVAHAVSKSPSGPWSYKETVLKGRGVPYWDAITAHNPKIKFFEGKYYLYYISTNMGGKHYTSAQLEETCKVGYSHPNWKILRPNQRTGIAVSKSINGPWHRMDTPLVEPSGPICTITVNPAISQGKDGKYYLIIKGDKPNVKNFVRNQALAISDSPQGPFQIQKKPVIDNLDTEDVSMWYDEERESFYAIFHAHTFIGLMKSIDGINWSKANNYKVMDKVICKNDGSSILPDRLERPFIYYENGKAIVLSMAVKKGDDSYCVFIPLL